MMFNFLKGKGLALPENFTVLDLGSSSVKSIIVDSSHFKELGKLCISGLAEEDYPPNTIVSGVIANLEQFIETTRKSLKKASSDCGFNPLFIITNLSGEFCKSISANVKITRKSPNSPLTQREWGDFEKKISESLSITASSEMAAVTGAEGDLELIEKSLVMVRIGESEVGVKVPPLGEPFFQISLNYLITFTQVATIRLISGLIKKLGKKELFKTSRLVNIIKVCLEKDSALSAIFIDLDGGSTDVAVVLGGFLIGVRTVPLGFKDLSETDGAGINDWLSAVTVALSDFEGVKVFPTTMIIYGNPSDLNVFDSGLSGFPWTKEFPFASPPMIQHLDKPPFPPSIEDRTGRANGFIPLVSSLKSFIDYAKNRT